jgi:phospholipid-binding lipoprotein MlaA
VIELPNQENAQSSASLCKLIQVTNMKWRELRIMVVLLLAGALMVNSAMAADDDATSVDGMPLAEVMPDDANDPLEAINRVTFQVNEFFYDMFLRGPTEIYLGIVPPPLRLAIGSILNNLSTPVILVNDLLQGEWARAGTTTQRFAINTTYGIGGMFDRATEMGFERHSEDFGQTLAVWGVPEAFYFVLPLLGPSNPRDAVGRLFVDPYFDPLGLYMDKNGYDAEIWGRRVTEQINNFGNAKDKLDHIKKVSIDHYAAIRSMYRQRRIAELRNGAATDLPPLPDLGYELGGEGDASNLGTTGS